MPKDLSPTGFYRTKSWLSRGAEEGSRDVPVRIAPRTVVRLRDDEATPLLAAGAIEACDAPAENEKDRSGHYVTAGWFVGRDGEKVPPRGRIFLRHDEAVRALAAGTVVDPEKGKPAEDEKPEAVTPAKSDAPTKSDVTTKDPPAKTEGTSKDAPAKTDASTSAQQQLGGQTEPDKGAPAGDDKTAKKTK
jgi:hypothetical protein